MRILTTTVMVSAVLAIASPRARAAIAGLRGEFAAVDARASTAAAAAPQAQQQFHWVAIGDYTAALAREQLRQRIR